MGRNKVRKKPNMRGGNLDCLAIITLILTAIVAASFLGYLAYDSTTAVRYGTCYKHNEYLNMYAKIDSISGSPIVEYTVAQLNSKPYARERVLDDFLKLYTKVDNCVEYDIVEAIGGRISDK
jgi:hypothetical protein